MRSDRRLGFEDLEARKLLSTVHISAASSGASALTPISLTGTLNVNLNEASTVENSDSSETTTVPVVGRLGSLGKVTGVWSHTLNQSGNYEGPDTLVLKSSLQKGSFTINFNDNNSGLTAKSVGKDLSDYQHAQKLASGTGTFARVSEAGSIELMLNTNQDTYKSLVLISVPPTSTTTTG
jgi:hypothetical protein